MPDCIKSFIFSPMTWIFLLVFAFLIRRFILKENNSVNQLIHKNIFHKYKKCFSTKVELVFFVLISGTLAMLTLIERPLNSDIINLLGVIISILIGAVLSFMAMTEDKKAVVSSKDVRNINENRAMWQSGEALSFGIIEIILATVLLVLLFFVPDTSEKISFYSICFLVYALFYFFLFNIFFMVKRLYEICEELK